MYDEGIYRVRALRWGYKESTKGFDQFEMTFEVLGEVDRNNLEGPARPCESGVRNWSITLTGESNGRWLKDAVVRLGYDGEDMLGLDPNFDGAFNFTDVEFLATCKHSSYNERIKEEWKVLQPGKSLAKERLQDLNERFGHLFRDVKASKPMARPDKDVPTDDPF
jgi:hypothetical protein